MFCEGIINKDHLELMKLAGYEFDFAIQTPEQAAELWEKKGIKSDEDMDYTEDAYVRFWVDTGIEDYFTVYDCVQALKSEELPLLIGMKNKEIAQEVEDRLRREHKSKR